MLGDPLTRGGGRRAMGPAVRLLFVACLCMVATVAGANLEPMQILKRALAAQKGVKDYTARVTVEADIPGIDIPRRSAKVYVKRPDKVYVESRGIVFIPKRALLFGNIAKDVDKYAKALLIGEKLKDGRTVYCIKLVPAEGTDSSQRKGTPRILVWIDGDKWTITRLRLYMNGQQVMTADFKYQKVAEHWMPVVVDSRLRAPMGGGDQMGRIRMQLSDYRVNIGLTDEFMDSKIRQQRGR